MPVSSTWLRPCVLAVSVVLVLAGCSGGGGEPALTEGPTRTSTSSSPTPSTSPPTAATTLVRAYTTTVEKALPSVVQIETPTGLGSGVIYDDQGDIVTTAHVVGSARRFTVRTAHSSSALAAVLVAAYAPDDLAVIRLQDPPADLHPARFGGSQGLQVGDLVLAMGVGIPTLAAVDQQLGGSAPGIGFAIPSQIVIAIADQIIAHGRVVDSHRAALGVTVVTVTALDGTPVGVGITRLSVNGAAARAGLRPRDVIVALDGSGTRTRSDLTTLLAGRRPGAAATVRYERNGEQHSVKVVLGELPGS